MKRNTIFLGIIVMGIAAFASCKKDNTTPPPPVLASSSFSLRGKTYTTPATGTSSEFQVGTGLGTLVTYGLTSDGNSKGLVYVTFYGASRPAAGLYNIVTGTPTNANQVVLTVSDSVSVAKQGIFGATGTDHVKATVTVGATGKLTISLPNTQLTGNNYNNTDPSNTVITTATATLSATLKEQ